MGMFRLRPRANGTVQYAQKLLHPSCTFRNDRVRSPEEYAGRVSSDARSGPGMTGGIPLPGMTGGVSVPGVTWD